MSEEARQRHNDLVAQLTAQLVNGVEGDTTEAMIVLESVIVSVLHCFHPERRAATEFLDTITARVVERLPG